MKFWALWFLCGGVSALVERILMLRGRVLNGDEILEFERRDRLGGVVMWTLPVIAGPIGLVLLIVSTIIMTTRNLVARRRDRLLEMEIIAAEQRMVGCSHERQQNCDIGHVVPKCRKCWALFINGKWYASTVPPNREHPRPHVR